jgi:nucleoside-diphosphate-sugar epimerase
MRVFVTGATGFIGSAIVSELLAAGHSVLGLARSERAAEALRAAGAEAHPGDLEDADSLRQGVASTDGVIHAGFIHDFSRFAEMCEVDRRVIETLGAALEGTDRPFIVTSGAALLHAPGRLAVEADMPTGAYPRVATEQAADLVASKGVRVSVLRLPPSVHGIGDHGFVPMIAAAAREKGVSAYVVGGQNHWPAVHRIDAARAYRLALEKAAAPGTRYHAIAEEGVQFREIATVVGRQLGLPVADLSPEAAAAHFGWLAHFAVLDMRASAEQTKAALGWDSTQPGLIADIDQTAYFA